MGKYAIVGFLLLTLAVTTLTAFLYGVDFAYRQIEFKCLSAANSPSTAAKQAR